MYGPVVIAVTAAVLLWAGARDGHDAADVLRGPDDHMRTVRVIDWLDGQAWSDPVQRRLNPPDGVAMHWSRLADLPLAAAVLALEPWVGRDRALHLAALAVPALLGGTLVALFFRAAVVLTAGASTLVPLSMTPALLVPLVQFRTGRVDHHGLQLVLVALAAVFLLECLRTRAVMPAAVLGAVIATSLAVGLETLPFAAATAGILVLAWVRDPDMAPPLAAFGAAAVAALLPLYPLTVPPAEWTAAACDRMTLPHLAAAVGGAALCGGALLVRAVQPAAGWRFRLAVAGAAGAVLLAALGIAFPQCAGGPYAEVAPELRYWLDRVREARSFADYFRGSPGTAAALAVLPLGALAFAALGLARSPAGRRDPQWIALLVLALTGPVLLAWQIRNTAYAGLVAAIALLPLAATLHRRIDGVPRLLTRVGLRLGIPLACASTMLAPMLVQIAANGGDDAPADPECDLAGALPALTDPAGLGAAPRTLAAPLDLGPALLLGTGASRRSRGRTTATSGASWTTAASSPAPKRKRSRSCATGGVDAVLFCRSYVRVTARAEGPGFLNARLDAKDPPRMARPGGHGARGEPVPGGAGRSPSPLPGGYRVRACPAGYRNSTGRGRSA